MKREYWEQDLTELCKELHTNLENGLSTELAEERLAVDGKNKFTMPPKPIRSFYRFIRSCFYSFGYIMFGCTCFCLFLGSDPLNEDIESLNVEYIMDGCVLLVIFLVTGYLRYLQANDDYRVALVFKELMPLYCTVFRDGKKQIILVENLVLGDILDITYGERIGADVRVFIANGLEFNNVALFGVSIPVTIDPGLTHTDKSRTCNVGLACSYVVKGSGRGIVIGCGDQSEVGIMAKLSTQKRPDSRVQNHYRQLTCIAWIDVLLIFLMVLFTKVVEQNSYLLLEFYITYSIALLPMCLPILIFFGLWHTGNRLYAKGCYIRNMEAASTLGLTTVLCCNMLGTLTMRHWRVSALFVDGEFNPGDLELSETSPGFPQLIRAGVLCNEVKENSGQRGVPLALKTIYGKKFDKSVLQFAMKVFPHWYTWQQSYEGLATKSYNSIERIEVKVLKRIMHGVDQLVLIMKGQLVVVLEYCSTESINNEQVELTEERRNFIIKEESKVHRRGRICFAYAQKMLDLQDAHLMSLLSDGFKSSKCPQYIEFMATYAIDLIFIGIIASYDPPQPNIRYAVDRIRSAGIKLVLLSQAEKYFAQAIAKSVGIIGHNSETIEDVAIRLNISKSEVKRSLITAAVVDMKNLQKQLHHQLWDIQLLLLAHTDVVFANTTVNQRSMVVEVCQKLGAVVTVVGQSVHDTAAIRRANVGVSLSVASKASRHCADVIVFEKGFDALVNSIEESRLLFDNLKKAIVYALSPKLAMILVTLAYIMLGVPFRLFIIVLLIIEIFVNILPALSLFYERPEVDLMIQKPKVVDDYLINRRSIYVAYLLVGAFQASAVFIAYFAYMAHNGFLPRSLIGLRQTWYNHAKNDLFDSYGQEWTWDAREHLEYRVSMVTILTIVVMQSVNLILTKTGSANLLKHGFGNKQLNFAVIYLICFGIFLNMLNLPDLLRITNIDFSPLFFFLCPLILINIVQECVRRLIIRYFPDGWTNGQTYYG